MTIENLAPRSIEEREERITEIDAALARITAEHKGRKFPDAVRDEWNRLNAEREQHAEAVKEMKARKQRMREVLGRPGHSERANIAGNSADTAMLTSLNPWGARENLAMLSVPELRSRAADALGRVDVPEQAKLLAHGLTEVPGMRGRAAAEWILATSDPEYERAFAKLLADPVSGHRGFTAGEQAAFTRAMAIGSDTTGGALTVPFQLDPTIVLSSDGSVDPFRQVCRIVTIAGTDTWKGVSSDGVTAHWYAEAAESSDDSPTVASPEIETHRASAWVPYSIELGQDMSSLRSELGRLMADAKVQLEATAFTTGTGTGEPKGLLAALGASQTVTTATAATYAADDAYSIVEGIPARFRQNMSVIASLPVITATRRFTTSTEPEIVPATFDRWLGKPLYETSTLDTSTTTTGDVIAVAGDFRQAVIVDRIGLQVELVPHVFGSNNRPTGQRGLFAHWRTGFDVLVPNALRKLVVG